jgi:hypothetical protein
VKKIGSSMLPWVAAAVVAAACGIANAQQNSPEATAAAKKHLADKGRAAPAPAGSAAARAKPAAPAAAPAADWNARLGACKNEAGMNLVKREKCVYTWCKGHWGEGDCPPGQDMPTKDSFKNPFKKAS